MISIIPNAYLIKSMLYFLPDITFILYIVLYILSAFYILRNLNSIKRLKLIDAFFIIWTMIYLISVTYSPYPSIGLLKVMKFVVLGLGLVFFIRLYVRNNQEFDFIIKSYIITSFLLEVCVIIDFILLGMPFGRFSFFGAHPIPLGMLGTVTALVVIMRYLNKKIPLLLFFIITILSIWIDLISSSKGPLISLLIGILILLPTIFSSSKKGIVFACVSLLVFYILSKTEQFKQMIYRLTYTSKDGSTYDRLELYAWAKSIFNHHPYIGGGVAVFGDIYPHDIFMEIFAEGGILLGFFLCLFILWLIIKYLKYLNVYRSNYYYYNGMVILISSVFVLLVSYTYTDLKFLYFGLGLFLVQKTVNDSIDKSPN